MNSRPIKRPQAPETEKSKPRPRIADSRFARPSRVRAAVLASRPSRAETEKRFNFREQAEPSARDTEPRPRIADSRLARLGCRPAHRLTQGTLGIAWTHVATGNLETTCQLIKLPWPPQSNIALAGIHSPPSTGLRSTSMYARGEY